MARERVIIDREWLAEQVAAGLTGDEIARLVGCGRDTVFDRAERYGILWPNRSRSQLQGPEHITLEWFEARRGMTQRAMAQELGCSASSVCHWGQELGFFDPPKMDLPENFWAERQHLTNGKIARELQVSLAKCRVLRSLSGYPYRADLALNRARWWDREDKAPRVCPCSAEKAARCMALALGDGPVLCEVEAREAAA